MADSKLSFKELFHLSLRTFRVKPVRAILTVFGMSVGIGTVIFLVSLGYGLQYILIGRLVTTEESLITMEVSYPSETGLSINRERVEALKLLPGVAAVSPVAEVSGEVSFGGVPGLVFVRVVEPDYFKLTGTLTGIGRPLAPEETHGAVLSSQTFVLAGATASTSKGVLAHYVGQPIGVKLFYLDERGGDSSEASSTEPILIQGIITDDLAPPLVIVAPSAFAAPPPLYQRALVKALDIDTVESLRDTLIDEGFLVSARIDLVNQARKIMNTITLVLGVFGVTALIVSSIGMFNTMIVGFLERIYEVGILKSIGATDTDVRNLFLMESCIMGVLGGTGGILFGVVGGKVMNTVLSFAAERLGGEAFDLFITPLWFVLLVLGLSIFIGLISGFWPAHRAAGLSPKEAFVKR